MIDYYKVHIGTTADTAGSRTIKQELKGVGAEAQKLMDALKAGIGIDIGGRIVGSLAEIPSAIKSGIATGVEFNMMMADTEKAIAAVVQKFAKLDEAAASRQAVKALEKIKEIEPTAAGSMTDLVQGFMATVGAAQAAGIEITKNVELVGQFANALDRLSIPAEQLSQEMRAIFTENIGPDAQAARTLGITNEDVRAAKARGQLGEYLEKQLASLGQASDSFSAKMSSLKSALTQTLGEATKGLTQEIGKLVVMLTEEVKKPEVVAALKELGESIASLLKLGGKGAVFILEHATAVQALAKAGTTFLAVWGSGRIAAMLARIGGLTGSATAATAATAAGVAATSKASAYAAAAEGPAPIVLSKISALLRSLSFLAPAMALVTSINAMDNVQKERASERLQPMRAANAATKLLGQQALTADGANAAELELEINKELNAAKNAMSSTTEEIATHARVNYAALLDTLNLLHRMAPLNEKARRDELEKARAVVKRNEAEQRAMEARQRDEARAKMWKDAAPSIADQRLGIERAGMVDQRMSKEMEAVNLRNQIREKLAGAGVKAEGQDLASLMGAAERMKKGVISTPEDMKAVLDLIGRIADLDAERATYEKDIQQSIEDQAREEKLAEARRKEMIDDMRTSLAIQEAMVRGEFDLADALERQRTKRQMMSALKDAGFTPLEREAIGKDQGARAQAVDEAERKKKTQELLDDAEVARLRAKGRTRQANKLEDRVWERRRREELGRERIAPGEMETIIAKERETRRRERGSRTAGGSLIIDGSAGRKGSLDALKNASPVDALKPATPGLDALRKLQGDTPKAGGNAEATAAAAAQKAATNAQTLATQMTALEAALSKAGATATAIVGALGTIQARLATLEAQQGK